MSNHKLIEAVTKSQLRTDLPTFRSGDTLRVHVRIVEGSRERIQVFEGVVIKRRGGGISETFTVRKISSGVGVERTFPLHTPKIEKSKLNVAVKYVVLNYTTYVVYVVKLLESKKFVNQQTRHFQHKLFVTCNKDKAFKHLNQRCLKAFRLNVKYLQNRINKTHHCL